MDYTEVGAGARIVRAIVDRHNKIPPRTELDPAGGEAGAVEVHRDGCGILVVPRGEPAGPLFHAP
jgi:ADP-glucose pyrophosphorylase